jgi:hypothetical protein
MENQQLRDARNGNANVVPLPGRASTQPRDSDLSRPPGEEGR